MNRSRAYIMSKRKAQTPHAELPAFQLAEFAENPEAAQDAFRDNKLLLVRGFSAHNGESRCLKALQKVLERDAGVLHDSWCVENPGSAKEASLGLEEVLNKQEKRHAENYYVSCIIQGDNNLVGEFEKDVDFKDPSFTSKWKTSDTPSLCGYSMATIKANQHWKEGPSIQIVYHMMVLGTFNCMGKKCGIADLWKIVKSGETPFQHNSKMDLELRYRQAIV